MLLSTRKELDRLKARVAALEECQLVPAELARIAGVPPSMIRRWKRDGLLLSKAPPGRFVRLELYTTGALAHFVRAVAPHPAVAHLVDWAEWTLEGPPRVEWDLTT